MVNSNNQDIDDPKLSNNMILSDKNLEKRDQSSLIDNSQNKHVPVNNDNIVSSKSVTNMET